jgi:hypothetical protein
MNIDTTSLGTAHIDARSAETADTATTNIDAMHIDPMDVTRIPALHSTGPTSSRHAPPLLRHARGATGRIGPTADGCVR